MFFKVTNESKGPRFIVTSTGRTVILPGEKNAKRVQMEPEVARQYVAFKESERGGSFKVEAIDGDSRSELGKPIARRERARLAPDALRPPHEKVVKTPYDEMVVSEEANPDVNVDADDKAKAKAELLARADDMDIADLRTEAKMLLGKDWPETGDRFGKPRIKSLLES